MINAPCRDCKDRHINCHSTCDKYKVWKQEVDIIKERVTAKRLAEGEEVHRKNEAIARMKKRHAKRIR